MPAAFQKMIGATSGDVAALLEDFSRFATGDRMPAAVRRDLLVVLDELLANVVMHGVGTQPDGSATVSVDVRPDAVHITVADNGPPFDPLARALPDTTLSVDERPIGGLGIHLVQRLVDHTHYAREQARNILTLTKRLPDGWSRDPEGAR
jgi:anti-sigma regulatory factor (Ser/Thr protein kinase)